MTIDPAKHYAATFTGLELEGLLKEFTPGYSIHNKLSAAVEVEPPRAVETYKPRHRTTEVEYRARIRRSIEEAGK